AFVYCHRNYHDAGGGAPVLLVGRGFPADSSGNCVPCDHDWCRSAVDSLSLGRIEIGPWLLSASLLFLHLDWPGVTTEIPNGVFLVADILLGVGMLFLVFDDSRVHTRQLAVVESLTSTIGKTQQPGPMMQAALEELRKLFHAKAAWFGALDSDRVTISNHLGVSPEFLKGASLIHLDASVQRGMASSRAAVVLATDMMPSVRAYMEDEGLHHLVLAPVQGKKAPLGTLALGKSHPCSYSAEELDFLHTGANQVGIAVENLRLLE